MDRLVFLLLGLAWTLPGCSPDERAIALEGNSTTTVSLEWDEVRWPDPVFSSPSDTIEPDRVYEGEGLILGFPSVLAVAGDRLLVGDQFISPHLSVVSGETGNLVYRFGPEGEGPGDFKVPGRIQRDTAQDDRFTIFDRSLQRFTPVAIGPEEAELGDPIRFTAPFLMLDPIWDGRTLVTNLLHGRSPLRRIDLDSGRIEEIELPSFRQRARDSPLVAYSRMVRRPGAQTFALAYQHTARMDLVRLDDRTGVSVRAPEQVSQDIERAVDGGWSPGEPRAFVGVAATRERIVAIYCDECHRDAYPDRVIVSDWDGVVQCTAVVRPNVTVVAIGESSYLYGITMTDGGPRIARWSLRSCLT